MVERKIELIGRVFFTFDILTLTGLHIGGSDSGIEIGGVDKTVIRDPLTNRPYIPGSSIKGKMRSLIEKYQYKEQNQRIGQGYIHSCGADGKDDESRKKGEEAYRKCDVCQIFGLPGERGYGAPTRLVVRDVHLSGGSAERLESQVHTDLPYTEVKTEVAIDRVTSAANPRQMERIPAGVIFGKGVTPEPQDDKESIHYPAEMIYSIYRGAGCDPAMDVERIRTLIVAFKLLEDDYLGGLGSRGSGKIKLQDIRIRLRHQDYLAAPVTVGKDEYSSLENLIPDCDAVISQVKKIFGLA